MIQGARQTNRLGVTMRTKVAARDETKAIENATVTGFLKLYNLQRKDDFSITEHRDYESPDFVCTNSGGQRLYVEATTAHDREGDMAVLLGRASSRKAPKSVRLRDYVLANLIAAIHKKSLSRHQKHTALVIRHSSGVDWDWEMEMSEIRSRLSDVVCPFDEGVWIIDRTMTRIWRLL